ncbi:MAG: formylglycine-generating enzyme family protein [Verrucomicrobiaceae bacterium]|nr:formylglycine-generating enzyme family protein [Verrucomicrobiaceae bacterium]
MRTLLFSLLACGSILAQNTPPELKLDLGGGVTMDMVLIQPGSFEQGSPASEAGREADESPQRRVTITRGYYIGKYAVTRGQFARFVDSMRYKTEAEQGPSGGFGVVDGKLVQQKQFNWRNPGFPQTDDHPVTIVTAQDAKAFCQWLATRNRRDCNLPTEAQWEYACRAGTSGARYLEPVDDVAWHRGNSGGQTHPVGQKKPNAWGLHDLYGPVWQWCGDWYAPYPAGPASDPLQTNPNLSDKPRQALRGGSFLSDVSHARSAERYRNDARSRNADNGFRVACSITQRAAPPPRPPAPAPSPTARPAQSPSHTSTPAHFDDFQPKTGRGFNPFSLLIIPALLFVGYKVLKGIFGSFGGRSNVLDTSPLTPRGAADFLGAGAQPIAQRFAFRMSDSGFYITGPQEAVGTQIQYTADLGERVLTDDILFTPGPEGQFIFTGARPKSVSVRTTGGQLGTTGGTVSSSLDDDDHHRRSFSSSPSRRSFPSAY